MHEDLGTTKEQMDELNDLAKCIRHGRQVTLTNDKRRQIVQVARHFLRHYVQHLTTRLGSNLPLD